MNREIRLQLHKISSDSNCILAIDQGETGYGVTADGSAVATCTRKHPQQFDWYMITRNP